jgi:hypothetical protein
MGGNSGIDRSAWTALSLAKRFVFGVKSVDYLLIKFLSLPHTIIYGIVGAIAGIIGAVLGHVLGKLFNARKASGIVTLIAIIVSVQASRNVIQELEKEVAPSQVIEEMKRMKVYATIFRLHPEAEAEAKSYLQSIVHKGSIDEIVAATTAYTRDNIVFKYVFKHIPFASDDAVHKMLVQNLIVIKSLKSIPTLCVDYYLGRGNIVRALPKDTIEMEFNLKAEILESAISNPSHPPKQVTLGELGTIIAEGYKKKSYNLDDLGKIDQIAGLYPDEGCKVATEFVDVLASMDTQQSGYVFKNLIYLSSKG